MTIDEAVPIIKVLIIGPSGAGKSALLIRYCDDEFDAESSTATIGVDFKIKKVTHAGQPYRLNLLDTAGQERFRTLSTSYYRGAQAVLLAYDAASRDSFAQMERWFDECDANAAPAAVRFLVACKSDVRSGHGQQRAGRAGDPPERRNTAGADGRRPTEQEGRALAQRRGAIGWAECSAKDAGRGAVDDIFAQVVEAVVKTPGLMPAQRRSAGIIVGGLGGSEQSGICC